MTAHPLVTAHTEAGVTVLTLDNPPMNVNTLDTMRILGEFCVQLERSSTRVAVVTGRGDRAFCAGSDINEFLDVRHNVVEKKLRQENATLNALAALPIPTIAAINGHALGGGMEIALACDIRIADIGARVGFPEIRLGVFPAGGGVFRLPQVVGQGTAMRLMMTGDQLTASQALDIGLVDVVSEAGQALADAMALATSIAAKPVTAIRAIKRNAVDAHRRSVSEATDMVLADSSQVFADPSVEEGVNAFFDKRPPQFHPAD